MTCVWFAVSLGGCDYSGLLNTTVTDARELVKGEIWAVTVSTSTRSVDKYKQMILQTYYVIAPTCEVIGSLPQPNVSLSPISGLPNDHAGIPLRVDWSDYLTHRLSLGNHNNPPPSLLAHLKWTNCEEYDKGISKVWLARICHEGDSGMYKKTVAERYIIACVMENRYTNPFLSIPDISRFFSHFFSSFCEQY